MPGWLAVAQLIASGAWTVLLIVYLQPLREIRRDTNKLLERVAFLEGQFEQFAETFPIRPVQGGRRAYDTADDRPPTPGKPIPIKEG